MWNSCLWCWILAVCEAKVDPAKTRTRISNNGWLERLAGKSFGNWPPGRQLRCGSAENSRCDAQNSG
jgi:hypothetical protein